MTQQALVKKGYDANLVKLGFYPVDIKFTEDDDGDIRPKVMKIADVKNNRELHFELENYYFERTPVKEFKGLPKQIGDVMKKDKKNWFDDYEVVKPREEERELADPFLLGIKNGKRYLVTTWDSDIWEMAD